MTSAVMEQTCFQQTYQAEDWDKTFHYIINPNTFKQSVFLKHFNEIYRNTIHDINQQIQT